MAERRMFTQKIVDSDAFLDMPLSTQALYFHLNMRADDDGFVNSPKKIGRMIGASDDDLKLLLAKRFILGFETGVIVIKHWRMNNLLRKDRYNPTQYQEEFKMLELKENGAYTEVSTNETESLATTWQPSGNQMAPQYSIGKDSIGKDSIGKDSIGKDSVVDAVAIPVVTTDIEIPDETQDVPDIAAAAAAPRRRLPYPPTLEMVQKYAEMKGLTAVNCNRFHNFWTDKNWLKKGQKFDWRITLAEWNEDDLKKQKQQQKALRDEYIQRDSAFEPVNFDERMAAQIDSLKDDLINDFPDLEAEDQFVDYLDPDMAI